LIERNGRKLVFLINFFGSAVSTLLLAFVQGTSSFLVVSSMTFFFIVGSWTALYVTTPELFPTAVRASAFTVAHGSGKFAGFLSPLIFAYFWDNQVRPLWFLLIVAGSFVLAAFTAACLLIETAGKRLQDGISPTLRK
jgi:putative MFS transporter